MNADKNTTPASRCTHSRRVACFIALAIFAIGCGESEKEQTPIATVQTTLVRRAPITQIVTAEAVVFPVQQAVISPKITSPIRQFLVQRGSKVHKGQLLAILENADLSAAEEQSKGEFEQAEAGFATATGASLPQQMQKAELDAAAAKSAFAAQQKIYDSRKNLLQQGALPRRDLDAAEVALAQARSTYETARKQFDDLKRLGEKQQLKSAGGQLAAAQGKYLGARAQLSYSEIRSPIDGVVTERPLYPGELATANQPLLTVMDTSRLIAKMHVAQAEALALKVGNPAELKPRGSDESIKAKVSLISPALDPGSTTIEVWVEAAAPNSVLKPGMTVEVSMSGKSAKDALVVPTPAIFRNAEGHEFVLVAGSDGKAHMRTVETGIRASGLAQIINGVAPGESVISSGGYALPDGTQIKVEAAPAQSASDAKSGGAKPAAERKE